MKIIHCADIHLDSALNTHLTAQQAQKRRNEILLSFQKMVDFAQQQGVRIILIAGDLFDTKEVSLKTTNTVLACIQSHPKIDFLYLTGNHDEASLTGQNQTGENQTEQIPNLHLFGGSGKAYRFANVVILGLNRMDLADKIQLRQEDINLVMMHGQLASIKPYAGKNIDYMALGHIHVHSSVAIDTRGVACYSGCLEARGFDEYGEKGFVLLETGKERGVKAEFIPFAARRAHRIEVDISGLTATPEVCSCIEKHLEAINHKDLVDVVLTGSCTEDAELDLTYTRQRFERECFAFRVQNRTQLSIEPGAYEHDISLKGEFIRLVMGADISEEEKQEIMECGIRAMLGKRN